jgi:LmbE family N-acetylglucosaminyl deacetylase
MGTLVFFHAHPDDESISTGGSMARATAEGHRVVLVVATDGSLGEVPDDLAPGETLAERRREETEASAGVLGVSRVVWLGYADSGMTGWEQNAEPGTFHRADERDAAARLAAVLQEEAADVLTTYDWHGNYGHPDHVKVHRVGSLAAGLCAPIRVAEATMNRDALIRTMEQARAAGIDLDSISEDGEEFDPNGPADDGNPFGSPESEITLAVDVSDYLDAKRRSIACHRSQVTDSSFFLQMPAEAFAAAFGTEWYIEHDAAPGPRVGWLLDTLPG